MTTEIANELWVKTLLEDVHEISRENTLQWCTVMHKIGMNTATKEEWITIFKEQLIELHEDMIQDAIKVQNKLIDSIEQLLKKSEEVCKELRIKMPSYGSEQLGLFEERKLLQSRIDEYDAIIEKRKTEYRQLCKRQLNVCQCLGIEPKEVPESPLPSEEDLHNFQEHIEFLEGEKFSREERYFELKCKILDIVNELKIKPSLEMEKIVVSADDSLFVVSNSNMKWVESYYESLVKQREQVDFEISDLREKIRLLWEMLSEDIQQCDEFLHKNQGRSLETLEALKLEVKRCEDLKKANIEKFVKKLRDELVLLWDKCNFTEAQRSDFEYFDNDLYTEDLLTIHDMEVNKLKKFYEANFELFMLLEKRVQLWNKMLDLEERATAPDRFKNRGGQLLREEKERNKLSKHIPEIEAQVLQLANNFEVHNGRTFLSWGETIPEIIGKFHKDYEMKKQKKLSARKQQRELTTPSKSGLCLGTMSGSRKNLATISSVSKSPGASIRHNLNIPTPLPTKRKLCTPFFSSGKRTKNESQMKGMQSAGITVKINDKTVMVGQSRYSMERKKRLKRLHRMSVEKRQIRTQNANTTEYNEFEKEICCKDTGSRSTLFMEPSSSLLTMPLPSTPLKTPLKKLPRTPSTSKLKMIPKEQMQSQM